MQAFHYSLLSTTATVNSFSNSNSISRTHHVQIYIQLVLNWTNKTGVYWNMYIRSIRISQQILPQIFIMRKKPRPKRYKYFLWFIDSSDGVCKNQAIWIYRIWITLLRNFQMSLCGFLYIGTTSRVTYWISLMSLCFINRNTK